MAGIPNTLFVTLPVPAANGFGAPVDVSNTTRFKTFVLAGQVPSGSVYAIEASMDGTTWDTLVVLTQPPPTVQTLQVTCRFVRVRRNATGTAPTITLGAELQDLASRVTDVHAAGNPPLTGPVELAAGPNVTLKQVGNQIQIAGATATPPPPTSGNPLYATLSYSDRRSFTAPPAGGSTFAATAAGPPPPSANDVLIYQAPLALPFSPPNFAFEGRGIYTLGVGSVTFLLRMADLTDIGTTGGTVFGTSIAFPAGQQLFAFQGTFVHPGPAFGDSGIFKLTAQFSDPTATLDMAGITVRILNS